MRRHRPGPLASPQPACQAYIMANQPVPADQMPEDLLHVNASVIIAAPESNGHSCIEVTFTRVIRSHTKVLRRFHQVLEDVPFPIPGTWADAFAVEVLTSVRDSLLTGANDLDCYDGSPWLVEQDAPGYLPEKLRAL